jgi:hypothetical protein
VEGKYQFCDVYGTDPELLMMVPHPVVALLLLFPITDEVSQFVDDNFFAVLLCVLLNCLFVFYKYLFLVVSYCGKYFLTTKN